MEKTKFLVNSSKLLTWVEPFNAGIKSLRATLPDENFTADFAS
jgi:hypothetical protein